ncbi:hypothetical protein H9654_03940 [Stenotrophomonas sp. Sa5BUN4]|uniref:Uncharacterized protein n=1 Tax=Stenotrophomonas lacuserhaii TaxID=2760084 RepID=A0A8X8FUZ1_9GAMM|nr:hypothetical protein [Stenotrophomonas pennii]MBD7953352.1 hypothetical protein [Stenotrophomonas pennii]
MKVGRAPLSYAEMEAAGHFDRPCTPQAVIDYLNACIGESQGDAEILAEAIAYLAGEEDLRAIPRQCRLPVEVVRRQLSGRRTLTLRTMMGALPALGLQLRVDVAG